MARKKVTLQWIPNDATRRATFKKRRKGLMKKTSELATLCDVRACVVVYGEGEAQPEVWPSVAEAVPILARFKAMPELDQCKKMMNQEGFLRQRMGKLQEQIHKLERENRERETTVLLLESMLGRRPGLVGLTIEELTSVGWMVEMRLKNVTDHIGRLRGVDAPLAAQPLAPYTTGNMDMRAPMYRAPQQEGWLDMVRSGGDLGTLVYNGFTGGNGAGSSSVGGDTTQLSGFSWGADPGSSFPLM